MPVEALDDLGGVFELMALHGSWGLIDVFPAHLPKPRIFGYSPSRPVRCVPVLPPTGVESTHPCGPQPSVEPRTPNEIGSDFMKTMTLCGALAVGVAASTGSAQSVHELLGMNVPAAWPPDPADTGHASAEEAPFYIAWTVNPVIAGSINTKRVDPMAPVDLDGGKIRFDLGIGTDVTFGWRILDTYFFLQVSAGFTWNEVSSFEANAPLTGGGADGKLFGGNGNYYRSIIFTPGFEFDSRWLAVHERWPDPLRSQHRYGLSGPLGEQHQPDHHRVP